MIHLLLADDQVLFVNSLKDVLEMKDSDLQVVGVAYNGVDALKLARSHPELDVAILDIRMQPLDGVETAKAMRMEFPRLKIIMLTTFDDDAYVKTALEYGASGYLLKDMLPDQFITAIKTVCQGSTYLSQSVLAAMLRPRRRNSPDWLEELNEKEQLVLRLLSLGYNNEEIASELNLGKQTVKNYVHDIYDKMGVRDRMQAMRACMEAKLFE